jgi:hypothetical protein
MALRQTGKQRASRIPLDYFKHPDLMERWKTRLLVLAVLLAAGWIGFGYLRSDTVNLRYARGPVASVHAAWEANCNACHVSFTPIQGGSWASGLVGDSHASDAKCQSCHAGPVHHDNLKETLSCAHCHRDHQGRDFALARGTDTNCTECHANLDEHRTGSSEFTPRIENVVTRFDRDHPDFRSGTRSPGRLKFDHARHLAPGMTLERGAKPLWTLGDIPEQDRPRYQEAEWQKASGTELQAPVKLECASCHQLNGGDFRHGERAGGVPASVLSAAPSGGAYMVPITYENQCKACHPLTVDPALTGGDKASRITVPHRLQPEQVRDFLWGAFASKLGEKHPELAGSGAVGRPVPGKDLKAEEAKARQEIQGQVRQAEDFLFRDRLQKAEKLVFGHHQTCGECHAYKPEGGSPVPKVIEPNEVPQVWFRHALFNHAAHRAVDCQQCHHIPDHSTQGQAASMIPGIDNCRMCHAERTGSGAQVKGGARFDCAECHRYHQGATPAAASSVPGIGSQARGVRTPRTIEEFLRDR